MAGGAAKSAANSHLTRVTSSRKSIGAPGGFGSTDLDLQLKRHGIEKLITVGLIAHTRVEATARSAAKLGYDATVVKEATADYSDVEMHAALHFDIR